MEQDKEKIKRKAKKVVDNLGNVNLATLETSLEIVDKLEDVVETLKGHHQEMMDKPEKEMPEVSLEETNILLKELLDESKKKEEYEIAISPEDRLKLKGDKGDKGDTTIAEKIIEKTEVIREIPIVTNEVIEVAKYQTPDEIVNGLNTLKEKIDQKVIKGLTKKITDLSQNIANQAIGAMPVTTGFINGNRAKNINITGATVSQNGDTANVVIPVTDLSGYVPYTGATTNVDLGIYTLTTPQVIGSTTSGGTLTLQSTSHTTKGKILFGTSAYDEVNNRLGIGITSPLSSLHIKGDNIVTVGDVTWISGGASQSAIWTNPSINFTLGLAANSSGGAQSSQIRFDTSVIEIRPANTANVIYATATGVGIGKASSAYKLDVYGTGTTGGINTNIGLNLKQVSEASNTATYTIAAGGSVDTGLHYYNIVFYTAIGDTAVSNRVGATTTAGNNTVNITNIPVSSDTSVVGRKIYRSKLGEGSSYGWLVAIIADNTTTSYSDTASDASLTSQSGNYNKPNTTNEFITINDAKAMVLDTYQTIFGKGAGAALTTGAGNMLFGPGAGASLTTGEGNVVIGPLGLGAATTQNVVIGYVPMTAGNYNVGIGNFIWQGAGSKEHNVALGYSNQTALTTGAHNISLGSYCLQAVTSGGGNVAIGGYSAYGKNAGSAYNTALGYMSLNGNFTGNASSYNTAVGSQSGKYNSTGTYNSYLGTNSGVNNTTGNYNTFLGSQSGYGNVTGDANVFVGYASGYYETGSNKFFVDNQTRTNEATARTSSLMYGVFNATVASQTLAINASLTVNGRLQKTQGADVASATTIALGAGNSFELTGTTAVTLITSTGWIEGSTITLIANENVTITNGTATSGADITIKLAGAANFAMTADDTLTLILSSTTAGGVAWREVCRSVN